jgi:hypothetical protein
MAFSEFPLYNLVVNYLCKARIREELQNDIYNKRNCCETERNPPVETAKSLI